MITISDNERRGYNELWFGLCRTGQFPCEYSKTDDVMMLLNLLLAQERRTPLLKFLPAKKVSQALKSDKTETDSYIALNA